MNTQKKFSFLPLLMMYIFTVVVLIGIGAWSMSLSEDYVIRHNIPIGTLRFYGFLCYLAMGIVAVVQARILRPRDKTVAVLISVAFWLSGFPTYIAITRAIAGIWPMAILNIIGCIVALGTAIYGVVQSDIFGLDAEKAKAAEEDHLRQVQFREHH